MDQFSAFDAIFAAPVRGMVRTACENPRAMRRLALLLLATIPLASPLAAKQTVCTITVNSPDEREAFRAHLPADRFEFVELVERGRPGWLRAACERKVACDVLVVSGHFAGTEFYSSKPGVDESLRVDEIERAQCSDSCPGLFANLREVYLFGCDSLKAEAVKDHGEASRDVMRRLFAGTPVIYGFASLAPYGRVAGPMLQRHLAANAAEVGGGAPSASLLRLFGPSSMVATSGLARADPRHRGLACAFMDERIAPEAKLDAIAEVLAGEAASVPRALERVERFLQTTQAPTALPRGDPRRERYLATLREARDPALRLRMLAVARRLAWVSKGEERDETARLVAQLLDSGAMTHGDVDLVCRLNADRALNAALQGRGEAAGQLAQLAGRACLGSEPARARMLAALSSAVEADVQVAQAFFRHHPIDDAEELRSVADRIARMETSGAQVRALETLARFHVSDSQTLEALARLFARSASLPVQRAVAEIFVRAGGAPGAARGLAELLRRHRHPSASREELIDAAIRRLEAS
jgi:hypothetical protein